MYLFAKVNVTANNVLSASNFTFVDKENFLLDLKERKFFSAARTNVYLVSSGPEDNGLIPIKKLSLDKIRNVCGDYFEVEIIRKFFYFEGSSKVKKEMENSGMINI